MMLLLTALCGFVGFCLGFGLISLFGFNVLSTIAFGSLTGSIVAVLGMIFGIYLGSFLEEKYGL